MEFICETWCCNDSTIKPSIEARQIIKTDETATNWYLYAKGSPDPSIRLVARESSFSEDGVLLRIGSQVFVLSEKQAYEPLLRSPCGSETNGPPSYYEEFASRNEFFAFGSRAYTAAAHLQAKYLDVGSFGEDFLRLERSASSGQTQSQGDQTKQECAYDASSDSSSDADLDIGEGYESWSEGSTVANQDTDSDLDEDSDAAFNSCDKTELSDSTYSDSDRESDDPVEEDSPNSSEIGDEPREDHGADSDGSEGSSRPPSVLYGYNDQDSDDEGNIWNSFVDKSLGTFGHGRPALRHGGSRSSDKRKPEMAFSVFQRSDEGCLKKVFYYTHHLSFMLYESPPAFHPTKSLVAWPLDAGEVLFADFQAKTYFVRKLRASAPQSEYTV